MMVSLVFRAFSLHGRLLLVRPRLGSRLSGFSLIAVNKILIVSSANSLSVPAGAERCNLFRLTEPHGLDESPDHRLFVEAESQRFRLFLRRFHFENW